LSPPVGTKEEKKTKENESHTQIGVIDILSSPVATKVAFGREKGRKDMTFSFEERTFLRKRFTWKEYATLNHFLYVEDDQDGEEEVKIGDKNTTKGTIALKSLKTLKPKTWLNDSVLDLYFQWCRTKCEGKVEFLPSQFMQCLLGFSDGKKDLYKYDVASKHFSFQFDHKSDGHKIRGIFEEETVVVAINKNNSHWTCAVIFPQQKCIRYYDSFHNSGRRYVNAIYQFLQDEWKRRELGRTLVTSGRWYLHYETPTTYPKQVGSWDCGVFVCCLYESLLEPSLSPPDCLEECLFRRSRIALRIIDHCLDEKSEKQLAEEKMVQELRRQRKKEEKKEEGAEAGIQIRGVTVLTEDDIGVSPVISGDRPRDPVVTRKRGARKA
jgi:Ulp1 protease family, C-terminal catalytic domain